MNKKIEQLEVNRLLKKLKVTTYLYCTAFQKEEIVREEHRTWKMRK